MTRPRNHLIARPGRSDPRTLEDFWHVMAANAEDALLAAGAEPGTDYHRLELFRLVRPIVVAEYQAGRLTFAAGWPPDQDQWDVDPNPPSVGLDP